MTRRRAGPSCGNDATTRAPSDGSSPRPASQHGAAPQEPPAGTGSASRGWDSPEPSYTQSAKPVSSTGSPNAAEAVASPWVHPRPARVRVRREPGEDGRAKIKLIALGGEVPATGLPLAMPVAVQLQGTNGECWSADYGAFVSRNEADRFIARSGNPF